jgi:hypothetical protein
MFVSLCRAMTPSLYHPDAADWQNDPLTVQSEGCRVRMGAYMSQLRCGVMQ